MLVSGSIISTVLTEVLAKMERPRQLSAAFVKTVKDVGAYGDGRGGHGLTLLVRMGAQRITKSWYQRIRIGPQPVNVGLGAYPVVTLAEARAKALASTQGPSPKGRTHAKPLPLSPRSEAAPTG